MMTTTLLVLAVEEELVPQEFGQALEVDSLELPPRPQAQMAATSDQMAGYYLPLRAIDYSLAWSPGA